jgi:hypothetical protein
MTLFFSLLVDVGANTSLVGCKSAVKQQHEHTATRTHHAVPHECLEIAHVCGVQHAVLALHGVGAHQFPSTRLHHLRYQSKYVGTLLSEFYKNDGLAFVSKQLKCQQTRQLVVYVFQLKCFGMEARSKMSTHSNTYVHTGVHELQHVLVLRKMHHTQAPADKHQQKNNSALNYCKPYR